MTEAELLARLLLARMAAERADALPPGRFDRLVRDSGHLLPVSALLVLHDPLIRRFVERDAPLLVDLLRRRTRREPQTVAAGHGVRGRIDWPATGRTRASDPAAFFDLVCRAPRYDYDQPENQLLVYTLGILARCDRAAGSLPTLLRDDSGTDTPERARRRLSGRLAELWARLPPPGIITVPVRINERHLSAARRAGARARQYTALVQVFGRCRDLVLAPNAAAWAQALTDARLTPASTYDILYSVLSHPLDTPASKAN